MYARLLLVAALTLEAQDPVRQGIQRVIPSDTDIHAGMDVRPTLPIEDIARFYKLSVRTLGASALALGVTAVLGRADTLLMCEELKIKL